MNTKKKKPEDMTMAEIIGDVELTFDEYSKRDVQNLLDLMQSFARDKDNIAADLTQQLAEAWRKISELESVEAGRELMDAEAENFQPEVERQLRELLEEKEKEVEALRGGFEKILQLGSDSLNSDGNADDFLREIYVVCHEALDPTPSAGGE